MSNYEEKLKAIVDQLYERYDDDSNGVLDKMETWNLLNDLLMEMGDPNGVSNEDFNAFFKKLDTDGN